MQHSSGAASSRLDAAANPSARSRACPSVVISNLCLWLHSMGMGFFMGMFVGGSVTLLHAGMAGGLKGLDRMAFKRSASHQHSAIQATQQEGGDACSH